MSVNYQLMLDETIKNIISSNQKPKLLLHACCAPCSSYVLEYLSDYFEITLFFYNPNISPENEYLFRASELKRLIKEMPLKSVPKIVVCDYDSRLFFEVSKGLEDLPEGGIRCFKCYELRLKETAEYAKNNNFDYFCTTLSISPHKNAGKLNEIGGRLAEKYGVKYLFSDFKKRNGYIRSIQLSKQYNLYRQNYCGCEFSKNAAESKKYK